MDDLTRLSRRERQIMDIVYCREEASVNEVVAALPDPPSRTAVRTLLRILEEKGHLRHRRDGRRFIYRPVRARRRVGIFALQRVLATFYDGSLEDALAAHLFESRSATSAEELDRLSELIQTARAREATP